MTSDKNKPMPPEMAKLRDEMAPDVQSLGFVQAFIEGFNACYTAMTETKPVETKSPSREFDLEACELSTDNDTHVPDYVEGARWQFEQTKSREAELKRKLETVRDRLKAETKPDSFLMIDALLNEFDAVTTVEALLEIIRGMRGALVNAEKELLSFNMNGPLELTTKQPYPYAEARQAIQSADAELEKLGVKL